MARQCEILPRGERAPHDHRYGHRQAGHAIGPLGAHRMGHQLHKQFSELKWLRTASTNSNAGRGNQSTPRTGVFQAFYPEATKVEVDYPAANAGIARVASGMRSPPHLGDRLRQRTPINIRGMAD